MTTITLRDATKSDIDLLAWVMRSASRSHVPLGLWEYIFSLDEERALTFLRHLAATDEIHWMHHSLFIVAEVDGIAAGALCGYDPPTQGMDQLLAVMPAAGAAVGVRDADYGEIMRRSEIVGRINSDTAPGAWVVENVATKPEFRRRGVIDELLRAIVDRGREKGYELAQISVFIGNAPARNAYVKAGFEYVDEKRDAEFEAALGYPGFERLLQTL